jgi:drug/metabolite transporter (DMT)-like permease
VTYTQLRPVVLWMTGTLLSFCAMAISVRELSGTLSIFEVLAVRSGIGTILLLTVGLIHRDLLRTIAITRFWRHLTRNGIHYASQYAWATAITLLPLATVFALEFTMPAWTALLAVLLLRERLTPSRIGSVVLGFIGVLIIIRPGAESFQPAAVLVLMAAFGYAITMILTKQLTTTETTFAIIFWMNAMQLPMNLIGCDPMFIARIAAPQWPWVAVLGVAGLTSHYCLSNAFRAGDASLVVPLDFMRIPLIALAGWWLYGEPLDILVFVGAGLIISGVLWNLRAETAPSRRRPAPAADL